VFCYAVRCVSFAELRLCALAGAGTFCLLDVHALYSTHAVHFRHELKISTF
jgi:hypothetical protein